MYYYRNTVVSAKSENELLSEKACPICGGALSHDRLILLHYCLGSTFDVLFLYILLTILLGMILFMIDPVMEFLQQFDYSARCWIIGIGISCVSLPLAYLMELGNLKADYRRHYNGLLRGLRCLTCGNRFAGVVAFEDDDASAEAETAAEGGCTA